jgi:uncharacterized protein YgbK (DUF1537 family)
MTFAVIADDLTGASDTGVQLVSAGYRTAVTFWGMTTHEPETGTLDAVVRDTDSRTLDADLAAQRVYDVGCEIAQANLVYKKIDSSLRGPIAAELAAALEATGRERIVLAPAFPRLGRTTVDGMQLLNGTPVHTTELARDPLTPVTESHLPTLLGQTFASMVSLSRNDLADSETVRRKLNSASVVIVDASTDDDLLRLTKAVLNPESVLWAGSAGLATALSQAYPGPTSSRCDRRRAYRRILVVVGSISSTSRKQVAYLEQTADVLVVALHVHDTAPATVQSEIARVVEIAQAGLTTEQAVVLTTALNTSANHGRDTLAKIFAAALADVTAALSVEGLVEALVLTGGDTAAHIARRLGAEGISLEKELVPGVPIGTLIGRHPYRVITKAGAFGQPDTLSVAVRSLRQEI